MREKERGDVCERERGKCDRMCMCVCARERKMCVCVCMWMCEFVRERVCE